MCWEGTFSAFNLLEIADKYLSSHAAALSDKNMPGVRGESG